MFGYELIGLCYLIFSVQFQTLRKEIYDVQNEKSTIKA